MNEKMKALLQSVDFAELIANSIIRKYEGEEKYVSKIREIVTPMTNAEFTSLVVRLCEWEDKYEEMYYARHIQTSSNLFQIFFDTISNLGGQRPCNKEMFLHSKTIYKGLTFKLYIGQGSFHRISMGKRLIFQSH